MDNENLLNSIYQNIAMVLETIPEIRKVTTDCDFKALIISQEEEYQNMDGIISAGKCLKVSDVTRSIKNLLLARQKLLTFLDLICDRKLS